MYNYVDRIREDGQMKEKINKWLEQCPVDYDVIEQTSDDTSPLWLYLDLFFSL